MSLFIYRSNTIFLLELLQKCEKMLDGTLGKYTGSDYTIELKQDAKSYHAKPFPIPKIHQPTLNKDVDRLIETGVLQKINFQWETSTFKYPKKYGTVRFISDLKDLN